MAAPSYDTSGSAGAGAVIQTGSANVTSSSPGAIGKLFMLQVLQDGTTGTPSVATGAAGRYEDLAGTDDALTSLGAFDVGSAVAARQHVWLGRSLSSTSVINVSVTTPGDDLYCRIFFFLNTSTGTTLSTVIENGSAGSSANGAGTSTTVADTGVTTLDVDRLAVNLIGINDDLTGIASFTGETGGNWTQDISFESSTGTDGTIALQTATMASAGTINGGTATITSDAWGVIGFALIGTTAAAPPLARPVQMEWQQAVGRASIW